MKIEIICSKCGKEPEELNIKECSVTFFYKVTGHCCKIDFEEKISTTYFRAEKYFFVNRKKSIAEISIPHDGTGYTDV